MLKRNLQMRMALLALFITSASVSSVTGCASNARTVRTDTSYYPAAGRPVVVEKHTSVTTESDSGSSGGILSGTVDVVGEVVALPFRAVGGLARAIF